MGLGCLLEDEHPRGEKRLNRSGSKVLAKRRVFSRGSLVDEVLWSHLLPRPCVESVHPLRRVEHTALHARYVAVRDVAPPLE